MDHNKRLSSDGLALENRHTQAEASAGLGMVRAAAPQTGGRLSFPVPGERSYWEG